jgi:hypothetical protein
MRLAVMKARKINKPVDYCKIVILEGGEYDE